MLALTPLEDYLRQVLTALAPLPPRRVPLSQAHGLVLAEPVTAELPVPPWTNSAMDGYAVRAATVQPTSPGAAVVLPVSGDIPAGSAPTALPEGTAMRIMTGAMLPPGADAVVRVEDTDQQPGNHPLPTQVELRAPVSPGQNVRMAGEDVSPADPVLPAGTILSATALSALASVGRGEVLAYPQPRVAVVSTGAELTEPGQPLSPGAIPDSNSLLLTGLAREAGATVTATVRSGDTTQEVAACLLEAAESADLLISSGGVSAGAFDPLTMLAAVPEHRERITLSFIKVAMQPGKPQGWGVVRASDGRAVPLLMLPGNPVSVLVSFRTIVVPVLARLTGLDLDGDAAVPSLLPRQARAAVAWKTAGARRQHIPVRMVPAPAGATSAAGLWVCPTHRLGSGSHLVASLPAAQALAVVEAGTATVEVGDVVSLLPLSAPSAPGQAG
ncbi:Molybdopterin molybdenumtransferase [Actinomyces bovis]|uniref:Molybdopterin molybdenumtransferase n=1 Tax=Actinomyces bovis TaxID=1658 RepID=A0ABY1VNG6_9ACTO|nr:Molybdopterin molybdenumtransferase [Actinomyces bovis]VEG52741.1 Molybdopterin molybdenumtransferase [Actinomyces israelii]